MVILITQWSKSWVAWKCRTWHWWTKKNSMPDIAGPDNGGPNLCCCIDGQVIIRTMAMWAYQMLLNVIRYTN